MEYRIVLEPLDRQKKRWNWRVEQKNIVQTDEDDLVEEYEYWGLVWGGFDLRTFGACKGREKALKRAQFAKASLEDKDSFLVWQEANTEIIYNE